MDKLSLCRICLAKNVRMYVVASRQLQETFEKLTDVPFITKDRPMLACFFCYAKLKQCSQFHRKCMEAEIAFNQILKGDYDQKPVRIQYSGGLVKTQINHLDIAEHQTEAPESSQELVTEQVKLEKDVIIKQERLEDNFIELEVLSNQVVLEHCHQELVVSIKQEVLEDDHQEEVIEPQEITETIYCKQEEVQANRPGVDTADNVLLTKRNSEVKEVAPKKKLKVNKPKGVPGARKVRMKKIGDINGEKQHICDICQRSFSQSSALLRHLRVHTGEKPHKCEQCQRSFSDPSSLLRHIRVHTGEKPHKCEQCQRSFSRKHHLLCHIRLHTDEKPKHECVICQRSFTEKCSLLRHIRLHTGEKPFTCETCQRSFSEKSKLLSHIRVHTGEKPYKCDACQRSFGHRSNLLCHIRVHTGEKPYKCDTCLRSFTTKRTLLSHIRIHTGEQT